MNFSDFPESYKDLVEAVETTLVAETLTNSCRYLVQELDGIWQVIFDDNRFTLTIPKSANQFQPAHVRLATRKIKACTNMIEFEREIIASKIVLEKHESTRNLGYSSMGSVGVADNVVPNWQFFFTKQSSFYDFYLICKKYEVF